MTGQARAVATHQRILDAAVELFDEAGYGHTSLHDIIDRAGVTKGAFYYHFATKEALAGASSLGSSKPGLSSCVESCRRRNWPIFSST
jgi:hypothetical protein